MRCAPTSAVGDDKDRKIIDDIGEVAESWGIPPSATNAGSVSVLDFFELFLSVAVMGSVSRSLSEHDCSKMIVLHSNCMSISSRSGLGCLASSSNLAERRSFLAISTGPKTRFLRAELFFLIRLERALFAMIANRWDRESWEN